ncbi:Uncharacterized protein BM_BM14168, partial [Brugia malayi]
IKMKRTVGKKGTPLRVRNYKLLSFKRVDPLFRNDNKMYWSFEHEMNGDESEWLMMAQN